VSRRQAARAKIDRAWPSEAALEQILLDGSGLPGPRANLELAAAFADASSERPLDETWDRLARWVAILSSEAPTNHRREFLPFSAVQALGAVYLSLDPERRAWADDRLTRAAQDDRWRIREAAAIGVQRIAHADFDAARPLLLAWAQRQQPLLWRAALATLAEPSLLSEPGRASFALDIAQQACDGYESSSSEVRALEPWRILRKGLEYAPSVITAAFPRDGFPMLARWAGSRDADVRKVVMANLRKARLARAYPDEVEAVAQTLAWASDDVTDR
jgi:hypothetical protein